MISVEQALANNLSWFEKNNLSGRYCGYSHHPIWGVTNHNKLEHSWTYYGVILSNLILYKKYLSKSFLDRAVEAGNYLCKSQYSSGRFKYTIFEYNDLLDIDITVIHNALPAIALLHLYQETKNEKYLKSAEKNITWLFSRWWNGKDLGGCVNQDLSAAEALALLGVIANKEVYLKRAKILSDWALKYYIPSGKLKGAFIRGKGDENLIIPWYDAKTALSYYNLSQYLSLKKYELVARECANYLKSQILDGKMNLRYILKDNKWELESDIKLISPIGLAYYLFELLEMEFDYSKTLDYIYDDGSFPSASGYNNEIDTEPIQGWNQYMLLFLSKKATLPLPEPIINPRKEISFGARERFKNKISGKIVGSDVSGYVQLLYLERAIAFSRVSGNEFEIPYSGSYDALRLVLDRRLRKYIPSVKSYNVLIAPPMKKKSLDMRINDYLTYFMSLVFDYSLFDNLAKATFCLRSAYKQFPVR
jgi:hypothetical protein